MISLPLLVLALSAATTMAQPIQEPLQAVARGAGEFSTDFYKNVASKKDGNLIMSPFSAHTVLAMAAYGARGNTATEMRSTLRLPTDDSVGRQGFQNLIDNFNNVQNVTLKVANKLYTNDKLVLKPEYKQLTADSFRSESTALDFSKNVEAAKVINNWAEEQTNHKIKDILTPDDVNGGTGIVLLNAVYFKGAWKNKFEKSNTEERPFNIDLKTQKNVPTMFRSGDYVFGELPELDARFIEVPYVNENMKMVIVVPNKIDGLPNVEKNLHLLTNEYLQSHGNEREVHLYLPKFKIESSIDLNDVLKELNMQEMFTNKADFSGISESALKVDKVKQKAFIEVNEEGSEAAAVTGMWTMRMLPSVRPPSVVLKVDRPFLAFIVDSESDTNLFYSRVEEP